MDQDFLNNINGSPYVEEGAFSRLQSKAAQISRGATSMLGQGGQPPYETIIRSLWDGFVKKVTPILNDWNSQGKQVLSTFTLNQSQEEMANILDNIYSSLRSSFNPKYPNSLLRESLDEAFWDMAKRDIGLNKKLGSNDPSKIINGFKNKILNLYNMFLSDASKTTNIPLQNVENVASKLNFKGVAQPQTGVIPAGTISNVIGKLKTLKTMPDVPSEPIPGTTPPVAPSTPESTPPVAAAVAPTAPQTSPSSNTNTPSGNAEPSSESEGKITDNDAAFLILEVVKIIIETVKADASHSADIFNAPELPQSMHDKQINEEDVPEKPTDKNNTTTDDKSDEMPGEFVYNFHSRDKKFPGSFSINVGNQKTIKLPSGKQKNIQVIWHSHKGTNDIWVMSKGDDGKATKALIFKFYNDQAAPQLGHEKTTNVDLLLKQSKPMGGPTLDQTKIDPKIMSEINSLQSDLFRSLFAVVRRKGMEFKPKEKGLYSLTFDDEGVVTSHQKDGKTKQYAEGDLRQVLNGPPEIADKWKKSLEAVGYFDKFPDLKPTPIENYKNFKDAILTLISLKYGEKESTNLVANAWAKLKTENPTQPPEKIETSTLVKKALSNKPNIPTQQTTPVNNPSTQTTTNVEQPKVSDTTQQPKPEEPPVDKPKTNPISMENGEIVYTVPKTGEIKYLDMDQVFQLMNSKSHPAFVKALKNSGFYDKVMQAIKRKETKKKSLDETYTSGGNINPWNKSNIFLY
jgi:hypothetical protein